MTTLLRSNRNQGIGIPRSPGTRRAARRQSPDTAVSNDGYAPKLTNECWRTSILTIAAFSLMAVFISAARGDVEPVVVRADQQEAWVGQRVSFFVELRSSGSFAGAASFDLPDLPGVMVMKIGNPVVGSQPLEGESWFIQTHEFALFSQHSGTLKVPTFPVRFAEREGFTGPAVDVQGNCPAFQIDIQRPPGSEQVSFLVTTESLDIAEVWNPTPGTAEVGAIFKRTITQRAQQLPGMALAPVPDAVPDGVRVYTGDATTNDKLERGDFVGERKETVTYLLQKSGTLIFPELVYVWWNPRTKILESTTLPVVTFEVTAPPIDQTAVVQNDIRGWSWSMILFLIFGLAAAALIVFQWQQLGGWLRHSAGRNTQRNANTRFCMSSRCHCLIHKIETTLRKGDDLCAQLRGLFLQTTWSCLAVNSGTICASMQRNFSADHLLRRRTMSSSGAKFGFQFIQRYVAAAGGCRPAKSAVADAD